MHHFIPKGTYLPELGEVSFSFDSSCIVQVLDLSQPQPLLLIVEAVTYKFNLLSYFVVSLVHANT